MTAGCRKLNCMRLVISLCTLIFLGLLSACALSPASSTTIIDKTPSPTTKSTARTGLASKASNYGAAPGDKTKTVIESYMEQVLDEPQSATYRFINAPVKGSHGGWSDTPLAYGYVTCVWINEKNSEGVYAGEELHYFLIRNDAVVRSTPNANWLCKPYM